MIRVAILVSLIAACGTDAAENGVPNRAPVQPQGSTGGPRAVLDVGRMESAMMQEQTVLERSTDPRELMRVAIRWTTEPGDAVHRSLLRFLTSSDFLGRLDSPDDYSAAASNRLRISRVVESLARNSAIPARKSFDELLRDSTFIAHEDRVQALIQASAFVKPPTPNLVPFWKAYTQPEDGFTHATVLALFRNGTRPAIGVFADLVSDPRHEEGDKVAWFRCDLLRRRDDVYVLEASERLLALDTLSPSLKRALVESHFDYRPGEWHRPDIPSSPPPRALASIEALEILQRIGKAALARHLLEGDALRVLVSAELEAISLRLEDKNTQR